MKFSCERAILNEAVNAAIKAVSAKSNVSAIEGILIVAEEDLKLTGYNLEIGITARIDADISKKGTIVLNAKMFSDILRKLPDSVVSIEVDDNLYTTIKCENTVYNIFGLDGQDFPEMPRFEREKSFIMGQDQLKEMINKTIFAVSANINKMIHTGSLFEIDGDMITVVSVDGYRLAVCKKQVEGCQMEPVSFVVPGHALKELEKLIAAKEAPVEIYLGKRHIVFIIENITLVSRLLEGEFLNYKNAIPASYNFEITVDVSTIMSNVDRVSLMVVEKAKMPIKCVFEENSLKLSCVTSTGKSYAECFVQGNGGGMEIGFDKNYLLDAFKAISDQSAVLCLGTNISPCVIKPQEGEDYLYLVLPIRLKGEAE